MEQRTGQPEREKERENGKGRETDRQTDHKLNTNSSPHGAGKLWRGEGQQHHRFNIQNVI